MRGRERTRGLVTVLGLAWALMAGPGAGVAEDRDRPDPRRAIGGALGRFGDEAGSAAAAPRDRSPRSPAGGPGPEVIRGAIERALPLLVKAGAEEYPRHRDCFSCHNQAVPAVALELARGRGFAVKTETLRAIAEHTEADLSTAIEDYRKGKGQPGGVIRAGYALWALEAAGWTPDETTAAVAQFLAAVPGSRDHWPERGNRPPSEASAFTATALALRGLQSFPVATSTRGRPAEARPAGSGAVEIATRRARAREWLRQTPARETEERVFRLWGLKLAGAAGRDLELAGAELLKTQRPDGGWSQLDGPAEQAPNSPSPAPAPEKGGGPERRERDAAHAHISDAYATGSALVALHRAGGIATDSPAYRRGLAYLIATQRDDGTWLVRSRSRPFQPYFESGFPHGPDQFISVAASGWAVAALALACPSP